MGDKIDTFSSCTKSENDIYVYGYLNGINSVVYVTFQNNFQTRKSLHADKKLSIAPPVMNSTIATISGLIMIIYEPVKQVFYLYDTASENWTLDSTQAPPSNKLLGDQQTQRSFNFGALIALIVVFIVAVCSLVYYLPKRRSEKLTEAQSKKFSSNEEVDANKDWTNQMQEGTYDVKTFLN